MISISQNSTFGVQDIDGTPNSTWTFLADSDFITSNGNLDGAAFAYAESTAAIDLNLGSIFG